MTRMINYLAGFLAGFFTEVIILMPYKDPQKQKEYLAAWRKSNKRKTRAYWRKWKAKQKA